MKNINDILTTAEPKRTFRRRHGKIGRMTPELRDFVNQSLLEGFTYPQIIAALAERGHSGITPQNLASWAKGGDQDWLREREQATQFRARCEAVVALFISLPPETREKMGDINNFAVALQFNEILQQNTPGSVGQLINKKPENFFNLANYITSQSSEETRRRKLDLESKKFAFKMSQLDMDAALAKLLPTAPKNQGE